MQSPGQCKDGFKGHNLNSIKSIIHIYVYKYSLSYETHCLEKRNNEFFLYPKYYILSSLVFLY